MVRKQQLTNALALAMLLLGLVGTASGLASWQGAAAATVDLIVIEQGPPPPLVCATFREQYGGNAEWGQVKLESWEGSHDTPLGSITVTSEGIVDGAAQIQWSATLDVAAVYVKAGPGGHLYVYDGGVRADSGLRSPKNSISFVAICAEVSAPSTPEPTVVETPEPTVVETPEPTVVETPEPTVVETPEPTVVETPEPTVVETPEPTVVETPEPTVVETPEPTVVETPEPTVVETPEPTVVETPEPTVGPTAEPTATAIEETAAVQPTPTAIPDAEVKGRVLARTGPSIMAVAMLITGVSLMVAGSVLLVNRRRLVG